MKNKCYRMKEVHQNKRSLYEQVSTIRFHGTSALQVFREATPGALRSKKRGCTEKTIDATRETLFPGFKEGPEKGIWGRRRL